MNEQDAVRLATILKQLTDEQLAFVGARMNCDTDKQAAEKVGVPVRTVYRWAAKPLISEALRLIGYDGVPVAVEMLRRAVPRARQVLAERRGSANVR